MSKFKIPSLSEIMGLAQVVGKDATQVHYMGQVAWSNFERLIKEKRLVFLDGERVSYTNKQKVTTEYTYEAFAELNLSVVPALGKGGITNRMLVDMLKSQRMEQEKEIG